MGYRAVYVWSQTAKGLASGVEQTNALMEHFHKKILFSAGSTLIDYDGEGLSGHYDRESSDVPRVAFRWYLWVPGER